MEVLVRGCIVFDLDGTLVDSAPMIAGILNAMLADRGALRRLTAEETQPLVIGGGRAMIPAVFGEAGGDVDPILAEFRERYLATPMPAESLYPGARAALETFTARGYGLAVWSNKLQPLCDKTIGELGLTSLFGAVVGTGPDMPIKPDPRGLDLAIAGAGGSRASCCYVGDSETDHEAATVAGVPMVMMTHGYGQSRPPGVATAGSFAELPAIVDSLIPARAA
jgi:phosphoglycolate phosphatase